MEANTDGNCTFIFMCGSYIFRSNICQIFCRQRLCLRDEQLVSVPPEDELQLYQQMFPITLENVTSKDTNQCYGKLEKLCKNDGLYGNATQIYRNREPVQAYNGYLI